MILTLPSLTVGSAAGSIKDLFAKIKSIDAKHGKFDFALCIGDFFGVPKDASESYGEEDEVMQLLEGRLEGRVALVALHVHRTQYIVTAPMECYIMQGEHPLPPPVIEKFAKTGGTLSTNVFLLRKSCSVGIHIDRD